jgi:hypothetical protein
MPHDLCGPYAPLNSPFATQFVDNVSAITYVPYPEAHPPVWLLTDGFHDVGQDGRLRKPCR